MKNWDGLPDGQAGVLLCYYAAHRSGIGGLSDEQLGRIWRGAGIPGMARAELDALRERLRTDLAACWMLVSGTRPQTYD